MKTRKTEIHISSSFCLFLVSDHPSVFGETVDADDYIATDDDAFADVIIAYDDDDVVVCANTIDDDITANIVYCSNKINISVSTSNNINIII